MMSLLCSIITMALTTWCGISGTFLRKIAQNLISFSIHSLSGRHYDYSKFNNQVLEYYFPDHHSPPLNLLFMIIVSMDSWLAADPLNVAVVHCIGTLTD